MKITIRKIVLDVDNELVPGLLAAARREGLDNAEGASDRTLMEDLLRRTIEHAVEHLVEERRCRVCGCTDEHGCDEGCCWVEEDLCSQCAEEPE